MDTLSLLDDKLDVLLKSYQAKEMEIVRLRATIEGQNKAIQRLNKKVAAMDSNMVSVNMDSAGITEEEKENMNRQLDGVIAEIDKILITLND
ncbi:MAG: hypothetical protein H7257_00880 [Taibaiella sp.]|nr:hypothetical protein [Taibaiella sp.]